MLLVPTRLSEASVSTALGGLDRWPPTCGPPGVGASPGGRRERSWAPLPGTPGSARIERFGQFALGDALALQLARAGVPLRAVIGFHPGFTSPRPGDSANLHASVLMICGADDPVVPAEDRRRFVDEMREANVADWRLEVYGGVGHSFTNPDIATRRLPGRFAYDERADRRSWASMLALLDETSADRDPAHVVRQPTAAGGATEAAAIHINLAAS